MFTVQHREHNCYFVDFYSLELESNMKNEKSMKYTTNTENVNIFHLYIVHMAAKYHSTFSLCESDSPRFRIHMQP